MLIKPAEQMVRGLSPRRDEGLRAGGGWRRRPAGCERKEATPIHRDGGRGRALQKAGGGAHTSAPACAARLG
jgi:hypothetical protein